MSTYYKGYWNGEPAKFRVVEIIVGKEPEELRLHFEKHRPNSKRYLWFMAFTGKTIQAVEVVYGDSEPFYLSNFDGSGLAKVTIGKGSPGHGHYSVYSKEIIREVPNDEWQILSSQRQKELESIINEYFMSIDPSGYSEHLIHCENLKKMIQKTRI